MCIRDRSKGARVQPFAENAENRVTIMIAKSVSYTHLLQFGFRLAFPFGNYIEIFLRQHLQFYDIAMLSLLMRKVWQ